MQYDALNRLTQKNYSDGTPTANFLYDQTSAYGVTLTNTIGRKSSETTASPNPTAEVFSYDELGRVKNNSQCTPQNCGKNTTFPITYTYDLLGDTLSGSNGEGVTITYAYNAAPRLFTVTSSLVDSNHPATLLSTLHYNAAGALLTGTLGNTLSETRTYDPRLRLASVTNGSIYSLTIPATGGYAPDSNILAANDNVNGNWTYGYDDFNRLLNASATGQAYTYDYDRYGNRWHQNGPHSSQLGFDANNRITAVTGVGFDSAGNTTGDGTTTYTFDAENRISSSTNTANGLWCDTYNAEGQRVRKTKVTQGTCPAPTQSTSYDFLYDLSGHEIAMVSGTGVWDRGEVYAGGRHLATYNNGTTYFIHTDWLGTDRVRTTVSGTVYQACTSLPFGDNFYCPNSDATPMHFNGKVHTYESGIDDFGARYLTDTMGRFMSPDSSDDPDPIPYADLSNPQTFNLYAYVRNNPINAVDEDGHNPGQGQPKPAGTCGFWCWLKGFFSGSGGSASAAERAQGGPSFGQLLEAYRWTSDPDLKRAIIAQILGIRPVNVPSPMGQNTMGPPLIIPVPTKLLRLLQLIDALGSAPAGYKGGTDFENDGRGGGEILPSTDPQGNPVKYREWDVNPTPSTGRRDAERIVTGSDGSAYYTDNHYRMFRKLR